MILEGNERGFGGELARHLTNEFDNDHVEIHAIDGFIADTLTGAFEEAEAISQGTKCQKYLFSLSLNPPPGEDVPVEIFEDAVARVEKKLGLTGQPRALVFHEKNGRRHAHCVWSRIDVQEMKAIKMSLYKTKLKELSRDLFVTHGWRLPDGLRDASERDPNSYRRQEAQQAKRAKRDPRVLKQMFRDCWARSDGRAGFAAALKEQGFLLACGDKRHFVAVDRDGKIWSLSRWCGVKAKDLRLKLGPAEELPKASELGARLKDLPRPDKVSPDPTIEIQRKALVAQQRREREALKHNQQARRVEETKARAARLPRGLKAVLARLTGQYRTLQDQIAQAAKAADARDRAERQVLVVRHLEERQALRRAARQHGLSAAFGATVQPDPRQPLILDNTGLPYSQTQLLKDPGLVLAYLSKTEATFAAKDIHKVLSTRIDDAEALTEAVDNALAAPEMVPAKEPNRFTTKSFVSAQRRLENDAAAMTRRDEFAASSTQKTRAIRNRNA